MKATRYFSDYQSAYNYYGGNVVPSTEIALIGDGSYIFVSSDNAVSGNQQYFDVSMTNDEIVDTMTYTAYNNGVSYGEAVGFETGYTAGTTYGETIGYAQGYEGGYSYGYSYGYTEGEASGTGGEWEPIESFTYGLQDLYDGTVDSLDIYWGNITSPFTKEAILDDETGDVIGYRFIWEIGAVELNGGNSTESVLVVHEEYPDVQTSAWATTASNIPADQWFDTFIDQDTGEFMDDLYECVMPVIKNATMTHPQGGYQYNGTTFNILLDFEELVYENYAGDSCGDAEIITDNGIYPNLAQSYFNVNVEGDETLLNTVACQASQNGFMKACITPLFLDGAEPQDFEILSYEDASLVDDLIGCNLYVDKFNENGVEEINVTDDNVYSFPAYVTISLNNGDKVGFSMYKNIREEDPETGEEYISRTCIYWLVEDTNDENTHWLTAEDGDGTYKLQWDAEVDPESGDTTGVTFSFSKVNS